MQNRGMPPPPFVIWEKALSRQMVGEDLCFWPAQILGIVQEIRLKLGKKIGLILSEDLFLVFT